MPLSDAVRIEIFDSLKKHLEACMPPMVVSEDSPHHAFGLMGNKPVPYGHDKKIIPGMFFAAIANRKDSVAFYFFPSYYHEELKDMAPSLYKLLKGKTCFHFKKTDQIHDKEIKALLKAGIAHWKKSGYLK